MVRKGDTCRVRREEEVVWSRRPRSIILLEHKGRDIFWVTWIVALPDSDSLLPMI